MKNKTLFLLIPLLFAFSPMILIYTILVPLQFLAGTDCVVNEGFAKGCILLGVDTSSFLYSIGMTGWLMLLTIPLGLVFFLISLIYLIFTLFKK